MIDLAFNDYYAEELYMSADVETGVLYNRAGRRMLALTDDFLIGLHRALEKECAGRASEVMYACGKKWGKNFAVGLGQEWAEFYAADISDFPLAMLESLIVQEFGHNGWGILEFDYQYWDQGVLQLHLDGAIMAELLGDQSSGPADIMTAGILAGMFTHFMNAPLGCVQSESTAQGGNRNRFVLSADQRFDSSVRNAKLTAGSHAEIIKQLVKL
jgi:uncharacterized protein